MEERSRRLFDASVDEVDMRVRSRLTQARYAAIEARRSPPKWGHFSLWSSAVGFSAAAVLGAFLWFGAPPHPLTAGDAQTSFEDLDMVASTEEGAGDEFEMLQDDLDFYDWAADKSANPDLSSKG
jgi:hypothetical protein